MERSSKEWLVPLTGILFAVLLIISIIVQGDVKDASHSAADVKQWYLDNKDAAEVSAFIGTVAAGALIFYGGYLRKVFEGAGAMLAILPLIGLTVVAVGGAIDGFILFATADRAKDLPPESVRTMQALFDNDFLPLFLGALVFDWAVGLAVLRSDVLPKWMGWAAIVFGVLSLAGPLGFIGSLGAALWVIVSSIMLSLRARRLVSAAPAAAPRD
ncbi:MAG TPA: hypothetical protein VH391_10980 [Solirubrobacterales bacterium]|jgi:hypothetical protein